MKNTKQKGWGIMNIDEDEEQAKQSDFPWLDGESDELTTDEIINIEEMLEDDDDEWF